MCNREHKWIPEATKAPEMMHTVDHESSFWLIFIIGVGSSLVAMVAITVVYVTHKKQAMFNEIPTVCACFPAASSCDHVIKC